MAERSKALDSSSSSCERAWVQIPLLPKCGASYMDDRRTTVTSTDPLRLHRCVHLRNYMNMYVTKYITVFTYT